MTTDEQGPTVRPATIEDVAAIRAIYAHHVENGLGSFEEAAPDIAEMTARFLTISHAGKPWLVAERAGRVCGYAYASPLRPRSGYRYSVEDSVYIAPDSMGQGVGAMLLDALIRRCTDAGFRQMIAIIGDSANMASIRLHQRLGFRHAGTLQAVGFKFGRWVDSVSMQRSLGPGADTLPDGKPAGQSPD